jgi:hypothetical protein
MPHDLGFRHLAGEGCVESHTIARNYQSHRGRMFLRR